MKKIIMMSLLVLTAMSSFAQKMKKPDNASSYTESAARNIEPRSGVVVTPTIADLQVVSDERIEYTETLPYYVTPEIVSFVPSFKKTVFFHATKEHGCDALVASLVDVVTTPEGFLQITVTGYPAKYVNFRNATADDVWMVQMYQLINNAHNNDIFVPSNVTRFNVTNTETQK